MITGSQFIEHLYSQGYCVEEQREFGIVSGTRKTIKRLVKEVEDIPDKIKRTKPVKSLAEKIQGDINKAKRDIGNSNMARMRLERLPSVNNKATSEKLKDIAKEKNTYIIYDESGEAPIHNSPIKTKSKKKE